ncbi:MAG: NAD(P)H-dependent oxidoreductase subunit E, partial [Spirochaetia bacterium]
MKKAMQPSEDNFRILVCGGAGCLASGALDVKDAIEKAAAQEGMSDKIQVIETGCMGPCAKGPVLRVIPENIFYQDLTPEKAKRIVAEHLKKGNIPEDIVYYDTHKETAVPRMEDIDFFKEQNKIALRNCGQINPTEINEYIAADGYAALAKAVTAMDQDQVINEVKESGLRGRGGAGFPTWLKWKFTKKAPEGTKYVLCNADEGDPGAFMDRSVLEGDPHSLIEGMAIAAYTVGAQKGYVYVRAEYPLAVQRLSAAIIQAKETGLLGDSILGSDFSFDLEIRMGSGAFVCGEETALIASIEGKRGEPRPRPPFPAEKGLWDKPTLLNNVETYSNIAAIINNGAEWYQAYGTEHSGGTKVFALAGNVVNTGLVEVGIGTSLGELIYDIGGGVTGNKAFKAAQIGGPSGGCVPKQHLNVALDYESLKELGAIMGSG